MARPTVRAGSALLGVTNDPNCSGWPYTLVAACSSALLVVIDVFSLGGFVPAATSAAAMLCRTDGQYRRTSAMRRYAEAMTKRPGDSTHLDSDLGWMLGVLFRAYVKASEHALHDMPGGARGYQVLTAAVGDPPRNQGAIAEETGV